ncbi:MAG TPA: signal recognition particle protein [Candidatus Binatia bacterium]|nr:signal recognition particle protein [Candidatus Binatia bacterium]
MLESLSERFEAIFKKLRGEARVREAHIEETLREVRLALLEADVNLHVVKQFAEAIRRQALGQQVLQSLTPAQQIIKIVHQELVTLMGEAGRGLDLSAAPPVPIMLVGLQGSGKTTTVGKLARYLKLEKGRNPYLVPADVQRPAAIEQLRLLGEQAGCAVHPATSDQDPVAICRTALTAAKNQGYDVCLFDTAGRLHIDEQLMQELADIRAAVSPHEIVLVADAMTGQDAVNVARGFHERLGLTGVILSKMEGDARGGAALSIRAISGAPIVFLGVGEKLDALEPFHPDRVASRILGMGDVLSLIERAERVFDQKEAEKLERKLRRAEFSLEDFRDQLRAMKKMGSIGDLLGMIPGLGKMARAVDTGKAEKDLARVEAIINSMTRQERQNPNILNAGRRRRVALGSGTSVADINRFLKQYAQMKKMMKKLTGGGRGLGIGLPI